MRIYPEHAADVIQGLADRLGLSREEAAEGVLTILNNNMANAIRGVTIQKGHDPREFTLVAFGGAGPLHAAEVAESLTIPEVLVPPHPGITSAMGLLTTDLKYDLTRTEFMLNAQLDLDKLNRDYADLEHEVREQLRADGIDDASITVVRGADCRYIGQGYELRVPVPIGHLDDAHMGEVWAVFHALHAAEYGHNFPTTPIETVSIRLTGIGRMPKIAPLSVAAIRDTSPVLGQQDVFFRVNDELRRFPTTYYERPRLRANDTLPGPAIIFQVDSTTVVPPSWSFHVDPSGSLLLTHTHAVERSIHDNT